MTTCGDSSHGIGIVAEEFRANMAATRATDMFIIVGSSELLGLFREFWAGLMKFSGKPNAPLPYIVQYIDELNKKKLSFSPKTRYVEHDDYEPPERFHKNRLEELAKGDHQGAWEKTSHHSHDYDRGYRQ